MPTVLANRTYRHLLSAQIVALVGTGLATVALGLLAYDIAGGHAGEVLGTALAIKCKEDSKWSPLTFNSQLLHVWKSTFLNSIHLGAP